MGRRPDDPIEQAAKGYPGRRRRKVEQAAEAAAAEIAATDTSGGHLDLPEMFGRAPKRWSKAIEIWNRQSTVLRQIGRAQPAFRSALARYCIWSQVFEFAADQLGRECPRGNYTITWKMGHGGERLIEHPALGIMQSAEPIIRALDTEFGFTPRSDSDLTRVETFNNAQGRLPLGGSASGQQTTKSAADAARDPMDLMTSTDSPEPHRTH